MGQMLLASSNIHKLMSDSVHTPEQEIRLCDPLGFRCNHFICHSCEWKVQVLFFILFICYYFFSKSCKWALECLKGRRQCESELKATHKVLDVYLSSFQKKSCSSIYIHDCNDVIIHICVGGGGGRSQPFDLPFHPALKTWNQKIGFSPLVGMEPSAFGTSLIAFFTEAENNFCRLLRRFDVLVRKQKDNMANLCPPPVKS